MSQTDLVTMARAAEKDDRLSDGALYGKLASEIERLRAVEANMLAALKSLIEHSGHMSPFGGEVSVKNVRKAGKYMEAFDKANAVIAKAEGRS